MSVTWPSLEIPTTSSPPWWLAWANAETVSMTWSMNLPARSAGLAPAYRKEPASIERLTFNLDVF